jgi:hypothetical protein
VIRRGLIDLDLDADGLPDRPGPRPRRHRSRSPSIGAISCRKAPATVDANGTAA